MSAKAATTGGTPARAALRERLAAFPWVWSFVASLILWIAITGVSGRGLTGTFTSALAVAPYLVLVGIGQMFVITLGNGNIDLSVPYILTLAAFVSTGIANGGHGSLLVGLLAALGCGLAVAILNVVGIALLSIPPMVATLAVGLIAASAASARASSFGAEVHPGLHRFTLLEAGGIPLLAILCVLLAVAAGFVLHRTRFGRSVTAVGQNVRAADLTGLRVNRTLALAYVISGVLAALAGVLLAAYSSPNLDLGMPYQLNSIAVVVLGGSLIAGGRSNAPGVWGGTLFLTLLVTLLNVLHINVATQNVVKGVLIVLVLALVGTKKQQ